MSSVSDATTRLQESFDLERKQSREAQERDARERSSDYESELRNKSEEYNRRLSEIRQEAQEDVRRLKEETYDRQGKTKSRDQVDLQQERDRLNQYRESLDREANQKVDRIEEMARRRSEKSADAEGRRIEKALDDQKRSHLQEITALHDELTYYRNSDRDVEREAAQARSKQIQEVEGDRIKERDRIIDNYERTIDKLHAKSDERQEHYTRRMIETQQEAGGKTEEQIRRLKKEFAQTEREHRQEIDQLEKHFDQQIRVEKGRNERTTSTLVNQNASQQERTIQEKDATYRKYLSENKAAQDNERQNLEAQVRELKTTNDARKVSPYVAEKIQRGAEERYHERLMASEALHKEKLTAQQQRDLEDRRHMQESHARALQEHSKSNQSNQDAEKRQFLSAYQDFQNQKSDQLRTQDQRHQQTVDTLIRQKSTDMTLAERRRKDSLDEQREVLRDDFHRVQQETDDKHRTEVRDWQVRYRDLRRDFESKMAGEKEAHETQLAQMRYDYDKKLRDQDRNSSRMIEDRVRMYEHLIKQQEQTFKEKERFLTERYEEELARMKLTNARLVQKKS